jgi:hypothetical protein
MKTDWKYKTRNVARFLDVVQGGRKMWGLAAAEHGTLGPRITPTMQATLGYQSLSFQALTTIAPHTEQDSETPISPKIYLDKVSIEDAYGNRYKLFLQNFSQHHIGLNSFYHKR